MSQTPDKLEAAEQLDDYVAAWRQVTKWSEEGRSFSGREKNCCFLNLAGQPFADASAVTGLNFPDDSRGIAIVDWDHDGLQDLWVSARTAPQIRLMRNLAPKSGHFVALHLVGASDTTNRDAIGAIVEVVTQSGPKSGSKGQRNVKTLQAGEGYLSQSSKWIHFGLGQTTEIESVRVTWPGGATETWSDVSVDRHYVLEQSNPEPRVWQRPAKALLTIDDVPLPEVTSTHHHSLAAKMPVSDLLYQSADGETQRLETDPDKTLLVLLWASWCSPCVEELKQLADHYDELRNTNIEIVALSVDGIDDQQTTFEDAKTTAAELQLPFTTGQATPELLAQLQALNDDLFMSKRPLPLPCSFLIAPGSRLAALYKGPVTHERILSDRKNLDLRGDERLAAALKGFGLGGQWQSPPRWINSAPLVRQAKSLLNKNPVAAEVQLRSAIKDDPENAEAHFLLGLALLKQPEKSASAQASLLESIELAPGVLEPRLALADILLQKRQLDEAAIQYEQVIAIQPIADAHSNLGVIRAMRGDQPAALNHFESAVELDPTNVRHLGNLGKALLDARRYSEAKTVLERAIATADAAVPAMLNLSRILACAPDANLRDGKRAAALCQRCVKATSRRDAVVLDRLATAYAEEGKFELAVTTAEEAIQIANRTNRKSLANELKQRQELYRQQKPFRLR